MNIKEIEQLIKIVQKTEITELEVKTESGTVKIGNKPPTVVTGMNPLATPHPVFETQQTRMSTPLHTQEATAPSKPTDNGYRVKAPMVGTVYLSTKPDAPPMVAAGKKVKKGDALCLIEAMKMFNKIEADKSGTVRECLVENEQPVEYDQPLFIIDEK